MHRHHDLDLITALVEGHLADPAPAEELVASCPQCADVFHTHLTVRQAVEGAERPAMTEFERRRIRGAVWEQLDRSATRASSSPTPWWYRIAPVAAIMVVVVGVAGILLTNPGGEDAGTASDPVAGDMRAASDDAGESAVEPMAETYEASGATESPAQASATTAADAGADGLEQAALTSAELDEAASAFAERASAGEVGADESFACWPAVETEEAVVAVESVELDGEPVWFVAFGAGSEVNSVAVYDEAECTLIYRDE